MSAYSCSGTVTQGTNNVLQCSLAWVEQPAFSEQLEQFTAVMDMAFSFDTDLFSIVLVASTVSFLTGHFVGEIVKRLNRT